MPSSTGSEGLSIIKKFEGLRLKAYKCPAGVWTIGYGHTKGVKENDTCTSSEADDFLKDDVKVAENAISSLVSVTLNQNQYDALASFIFNLGSGNFQKSTLRTKINEGKFEEAAKEFEKWVCAGGKKLQGLVDRRKAEKELFEKQ